MGEYELHYENHAGLLVRRDGKLHWRCPTCKREGESNSVLKRCPWVKERACFQSPPEPTKPEPPDEVWWHRYGHQTGQLTTYKPKRTEDTKALERYVRAAKLDAVEAERDKARHRKEEFAHLYGVTKLERDDLKVDVERLAAHAQHNHECSQRAEAEVGRLQALVDKNTGIISEALTAEIERLREALAEVELAEHHGDATGDCPHDDARDCVAPLIEELQRISSIARAALKAAGSIESGVVDAIKADNE